ncbi:putative indole-3-acetic acid-amido synthetase GH3.5 [Apostichopus japonicus]|uniref:Putative indole-3-acetic acid-amido synthetase GH3.5 n=1 Tax=Stichopus japonicus TaxID=307972 RepID=A0A2G8JM14_STIJA|nr:putative indole-3-acetic acid-amido synthetase GH3.5 [Apostichopus japonicus]
MYNAHATTLRIQSEFFSNFQPLNKEFRIHCNSKIRESEAGITIAAGAAVDRRIKSLLIAYSTPPDGFLIENIQDAFYVHFLFALRERELGSTFAIFTSIIVDGFKYLEQHWPEMVEDIANGTINATLTLPASIREKLTKAMGEGDAERAAEVRRECERGQDGIMRRLWPTMQSITAIDNIGLRETLMQTVAKGIRVYSMLYGSSEALIGFNLNPIKEGYEEFVLNIRDVIFEFINEGDVYEDNPKTFLIDEVEIGKKYELVISQLWGLYRYRFGDVIQVTGFYQNCPKVKFLYRTATLLNLFGEKVDQVVITGSLTAALGNWQGVTLKHYSVTESTMVSAARANTDDKSKGAHYVFFLEMEGNDEDTSVRNIDTDKLSEQIDENIYNRHEFFRTFRDTNQISSCKVYLVKSNTFGKLKSFVLANTTASEVQFKMPKKLRTKEMTVLMLDNLL